ncbi:S41 family peptidase [Spongorhabdus nitratireducens]
MPNPLIRQVCRGLSLCMAVAFMLPAVAEDKAAEPAPATSEQSTQHSTQQATDTQGKPLLPLEDLRVFVEVMQRIKTAYVEPVDDKTLLDSAIRGMLEGLDPHSAYLKPEDYKELEISTSGEFGGLGMEVSMEDGFVKVVAPIDDTPASKAGILAGDLIIKLDEENVKGLSLTEAVDKMRGKIGEPIRLTIIREGASKPLEISVKRDVIRVTSVRSRFIEPGYGYLRLSQFQVDTDKEVVKTIEKLKQEAGESGLNGLLLDLRNNPGGVLQAAVGVSDAFIDDGLIVYTKGRIPNSDLRFNATKETIARDVPVVVLINGGTASASEIVAGALQDHHRAVVVGTRSFGKGSVQTVLPLSADNERGLKLTTALYYTPNGRSIQAEGIMPDVIAQRAKVTLLENQLTYREADLQGHLNNGNGKAEADKSESSAKESAGKDGKKKEQPLETRDYQLSQALNILKGLHIAKTAAPVTTTPEKTDDQPVEEKE